jgi:hypothetical protein
MYWIDYQDWDWCSHTPEYDERRRPLNGRPRGGFRDNIKTSLPLRAPERP